MSNPKEEFQRLYEACYPAFFRYCAAICYGKMDTRDLIQDSLVAAYENLDNLQSKEKFLHYLIRTARNKAVNTWRRSKFRAEWSDSFQETLAYPGVSPEQLVDVQLLYTAMNKLPAKQKEAVLLFEVSGFKINEIADLQNATVGAVKTRLSRARKKLKHQLTDNHRESTTAVLSVGGLTKQSLLDQLFRTASTLPLRQLEMGQWMHRAVASGKVAASGLALKTAIGGWKLYVFALGVAVLCIQADSKEMPAEARVLNNAIDRSKSNQWETTLNLWALPDESPAWTTSNSHITPETFPVQQPERTLTTADSLPPITEPSVGSKAESIQDMLPPLAKTFFGARAAIISDSVPLLAGSKHDKLPILAKTLFGTAAEVLPGGVGEQTSDKYTIDPDQVHYLLLAFNGSVNLHEAKIAVSNYNRVYHKLDQLQISHVFLGPTPQDRLPMIIVRRFENMGESMKYYQSFMQQASDIMPEGTEYQFFTASLDNYRTMLRQKSLDGYPAFFEANYINEGRKR